MPLRRYVIADTSTGAAALRVSQSILRTGRIKQIQWSLRHEGEADSVFEARLNLNGSELTMADNEWPSQSILMQVIGRTGITTSGMVGGVDSGVIPVDVPVQPNDAIRLVTASSAGDICFVAVLWIAEGA